MNILCSSVINYFKENISYKRLQRNLKIYTLRAIGRQIGLKMIFEIFNNVSNGVLLQDLLCWFNVSLKYNINILENNTNNTNTKFSSYLDNILGCGETIKTNIKNSFHNFMDLLINKFLHNSDEKELNSFLDTLIWKYNIEDHQFLMDKNVFNILKGMENNTIKVAWGKSYLSENAFSKENNNNKANRDMREESLGNIDPRIASGLINSDLSMRKLDTAKSIVPLFTVSKNLTNEILEVFEILSSICLDSVINNKENIIDIGSTSALIKNIINIIFGEIDEASSNYIKYRGRRRKQQRNFKKERKRKKSRRND